MAQNDINTYPRPTGEGLRERGLSAYDEILNQVQDDRVVNGAHRNHTPHYTHSTHAKRAAFTLAEVLITLGIIGVVAAMTIPTLIANYQEKQTISKLQKVYASLKNAFELAKVEHGDYETWSWNQIPVTNGARTQYFWETYIFPHLKIAKKCFPITTECVAEGITKLNGTAESVVTSTHGAFVLYDGTYVYTWAGGSGFHPHIWVYADINGKAKPNVVGKDIFTMFFSPKNPGNKIGSFDDDDNFVDSGKLSTPAYGLSLYGDINGVTVEDLMDPNFVLETDTGAKQKHCCTTEGTGYMCGAAIKLNGWKFPDGYPR